MVKKLLYKIVLKTESKKCPSQKLFVALEYNRNSSYSLFYWQKYHKEMGTVADHIPAYFL